MKTLFLIIPAVAAISACQPTTTHSPNQAAVTGATAGALIGAAVADDDDRVEGALLGGAAGAVVGTLIGQSSTPGQCVYRDAYGNRFVAAC